MCVTVELVIKLPLPRRRRRVADPHLHKAMVEPRTTRGEGALGRGAGGDPLVGTKHGAAAWFSSSSALTHESVLDIVA